MSFVAAVAWAVGCSSGTSPPAEPSTRSTSASTDPQRVVEPDGPPPRPTPELMRAIATGEAPIEEHVDRSRGVVFVEYAGDASGEDPRANDEGLIQLAERLCGEKLTERLGRLQRDLALRVETSAHDPLFRCRDDVCSFPAEMEYDRTGEVHFVSTPAREFAIDSVVRIEGGPVSDEFREEGERWAAEQLRRLAGTRCP